VAQEQKRKPNGVGEGDEDEDDVEVHPIIPVGDMVDALAKGAAQAKVDAAKVAQVSKPKVKRRRRTCCCC